MLLVVLKLITPGIAAAQDFVAVPAANQRYDIPAQPLSEALAQFGTLNGVDILYDHTLATRRQSSPVTGLFTPPQAMALLLRNTGLTSRFTSPKAAVIFSEDHAAAAAAGGNALSHARGTLDLDTLLVRAAPLIGSTGSFTGYARTAQREISDRLNAEPSMKGIRFQIDVRVMLDAVGAVENMHYIQATGDGALDQKIARLFIGIQVSAPPPPGLPQPLRFRIIGR